MAVLHVFPMTTSEDSDGLRQQVSQLKYQMEIDRRWVCSELDEGIGQNLQALSVFLGFLDRSIAGDQDQVRQILYDIKLLVRATQDQVELLRQEFHPHKPAGASMD